MVRNLLIRNILYNIIIDDISSSWEIVGSLANLYSSLRLWEQKNFFDVCCQKKIDTKRITLHSQTLTGLTFIDYSKVYVEK